MEPEIAGLIGGVIGGCVSIVTTFLSNRHAVKLQSSADSIGRLEKARAFQRDNLLACQEIMQSIGRETTQVFVGNLNAFRAGTAWGNCVVPEHLDNDLAANKRKFSALIERIADDEVRSELKCMKKLLHDVVISTSHEVAKQALLTALDTLEKANERLGTALRKTY